MKLKWTIAASLTLITAGSIACSTLPTGNGGNTLTTGGNQLASSATAPTTKKSLKPPRQFLKSAFKGSHPHPFSDPKMGIDVTDQTFSYGVDDDGDGGENEHGTSTIAVKNAGTHKLKLEGNLFPAMSDKEDTLTITDVDTGNVRIYGADKDFQRYHIHDGKNELLIETNPDGTWLVNGQAASTPKEVVKLALKSPIFANASLHGLAMLYELVKNRNNAAVIPPEYKLQQTLTPQNCESRGLNGEIGDPTPLLEEAVLEMEEAAAVKPSTTTQDAQTPTEMMGLDTPNTPVYLTPFVPTATHSLTGLVTGQIFDSQQVPHSALFVYLESEDPKVPFKAQVRIEEHNTFAINKVPVGIPLKIRAVKPGYATVEHSKLVINSIPDPNDPLSANGPFVKFDFGPVASICGIKCALVPAKS